MGMEGSERELRGSFYLEEYKRHMIPSDSTLG